MKKILLLLCALSVVSYLNATRFVVGNKLNKVIAFEIEHDNYVHSGTQIRCDKRIEKIKPGQTMTIDSSKYHGMFSTNECCVNSITVRTDADGNTIKTADRATLEQIGSKNGGACTGYYQVTAYGNNQVDIVAP